MAMLAEPRRKQKFGSDPRNTFWGNDDSKFGQRMLERMGWSKGKGLGASESGRTEHITAVFRQRDDTSGVGCSKKHADNWLAHQDDFNSLLESLNQGQETTTAVNTPDGDGSAVVSLVEKSKSSRSRVHYQKFTRGKDLSSRSAHDLDCIFGKRREQNSESNTPVSQSAANSDEENSPEVSTAGLGSVASADSGDNSSDTLNHGIKTVTSSSSVQEYFAKKMAELKRRQSGASDSYQGGNQESSGIPSSCLNDDELEKETEVQQQKKKKKKKKKSDKKTNDGESEPAAEAVVEDSKEQKGSEVESDADSTRKRKRKKKDKLKSADESADSERFVSDKNDLEHTDVKVSNSSQMLVAGRSDVDHTEDPPKKKKKKYDVKSETGDVNIPVTSDDAAAESADGTDNKSTRKKRKKRERVPVEDCPGTTEMHASVQNSSKKSVRFSLGGDDLYLPGVEESVKNDSQSQAVPQVAQSSRTSKKRKRDKDNVVDETDAKTKRQDTEPICQDSDLGTSNGKAVSQRSSELVNAVKNEHVSSDESRSFSNSIHKKKNKKKKKGKGSVDVVGTSFQGSNLSLVKGYGMIH